MKARVTIMAALAFGAALATAPAFAQQAQPNSARPLNDGGSVNVPSTPAPKQTQQKQLYNSTAAAPAAHLGRPVDDGGMVDEPSGAQHGATGQANKIQTPPHLGRPLDDGGL
jgi:hypothetical protein